jgi:transcriptional regulator of acetoin/glycerol metabolism
MATPSLGGLGGLGGLDGVGEGARPDSEVVLRTLERFQGNLTKAAQELGIARSTLRYRLRRYAPR